MGLAVSRTQLALSLLNDFGLTPAQARCSAHQFLAALSPAELSTALSAASFDEIPEAAGARAGAAARQACLGTA